MRAVGRFFLSVVAASVLLIDFYSGILMAAFFTGVPPAVLDFLMTGASGTVIFVAVFAALIVAFQAWLSRQRPSAPEISLGFLMATGPVFLWWYYRPTVEWGDNPGPMLALAMISLWLTAVAAFIAFVLWLVRRFGHRKVGR